MVNKEATTQCKKPHKVVECVSDGKVPNPSKKYENREIPTNKEIDAMLEKADLIPNNYFRLRMKCLVALVKKFGKRRKELAILE